MDDETQARTSELKQLTNKFGQLSDAENKLLENFPIGKRAVCGPSGDNPKDADHWGQERQIRAELVAWLCEDEKARKYAHPHGIQLYGADITGRLELSRAIIAFPLSFNHCRLKDGINLDRAEVSELDFDGSLVHGISANSVIVKHYVYMTGEFTANGEVNFLGAQVGRNFDCSGGTFNNKDGVALHADGIKVEHSIFLRGNFMAQGEVRLLVAQVGGNLDCGDGSFANEGGVALYADGIKVGHSIFFRNGFTATGEVRLLVAQVGGNLDCEDGSFTAEGKKALLAYRTDVKGSIFLRNGFIADGQVDLVGAQVGGDLNCEGGKFSSKSGTALIADGINVTGNIFFRNKFVANGEVHVIGAQVGGDFDCDVGSFTNESGDALQAERIDVKGSAFFRNRFTSNGTVRLSNGTFGGDLDCERGTFTDHGGDALVAEGINVKGTIFLRDKFTANGAVRLVGAQVGGDLECDGGTFTQKKGDALQAERIEVRGSIFLTDRFTANGAVRLSTAKVGGNLDCTSGIFSNEGGDALAADGINVKGAVHLRNGFTASGTVRFMGAQVGLDLICDAGTFINEGKEALNAAEINTKGSVYLRRGSMEGEEGRFSAKGEVSLIQAQIEGQLDCSGGYFSNPKELALNAYRVAVRSSVFLGDGFSAYGGVNLQGAQIGGTFDCADGNFQKATLDLSDASAGTLIDSGLNDAINTKPPTMWPEQNNLLLDGFVYRRILSDGKINVDNRIKKWLVLQVRPQPYLQLAKVLRESGDDTGAKHVLIEMEHRMRKGDFLAGAVRPLLRWTVGYGYDPLRAFWWAAGLSGLGWIIYRRSYLAGGIVPTDKDVCAEFKKPERKLLPHYPNFSPFIYSLENSLPLVKLGQGDKWQPDPEPDHPGTNQVPTKMGYRGIWTWRNQEPQKHSAEKGSESDTYSTTTQTVSASIPTGGGASAAAAPALEPASKPMPTVSKPSLLGRVLIAVGLKPSMEATGNASFLRRFGTSPRFVTWFLWIQILLGWLLATLFVAGVSGIVRKD